MKNGLIYENDELMYYKDGIPLHAGVVEVDGALYYIGSKGKAVKGRHVVHKTMTNGLIEHGIYTFDENYKLVRDSYIPLKTRKRRKRSHSKEAKRYWKKAEKIILFGVLFIVVMIVGIFGIIKSIDNSRVLDENHNESDINHDVNSSADVFSSSYYDVENYVMQEAKRVARNVYSHQSANTFSFVAISDMHYIEDFSNIRESIRHAGQGIDLVRERVNLDFAVCLGDNGWGSGVVGSQYRATIEQGISEILSANACIDKAFRGIPNFRLVGNHESLIYNMKA